MQLRVSYYAYKLNLSNKSIVVQIIKQLKYK